jgi:CDP-diacylglycerol--glycerol-3-phosphate 3-phosphatidyltransferase
MDTRTFWTIPNVLCVFRIVGSPFLLLLAWLNWTNGYLVLVVALFLSDWLDGKLAILLRQRSPFGARLDSVADVTMYAAILVSLLWMRGDVLWRHWPWIASALIAYGVSSSVAWWKFGCWPSYHTRAAKTCWLLMAIAVIALIVEGSVWFLRLALVAVTVTNLEMLAITFVLPQWQADVPSLYHAWRRSKIADELSDRVVRH